MLLTVLDLDSLDPEYVRKAIGQAIRQMINDHSGLPVVAICPLDPTERDDGTHLTGKGLNFVSKMRELNLIEEGC